MSYAAIDPVVQEWVKANALVLFTSWAEAPARFCYLSSRQGECLQISIDPPDAGNVRIHVWDIETANDEEVHMEWSIAASELRQGLDVSLNAARKWFERDRA